MDEIPDEIKSHGAIVKIVFHNFLTYDHVEVRPGPFLNVIIGPNGTGKSTIICGICLAVGGSPKILGRSDQIGDFIKHNKETGYVDIFLFDKKKKSLNKFRVTITKPNSAKYSINDAFVTRDEHCHKILEYNIQVDNPCTFLAQDKVKSFAEQDTKQLLKNTEKAGPFELLKMHADLETFFRNGEDICLSLDNNKKRIEIIQQNLKTLKNRAENFQERERRHFKINLLKKRKCLFAYEKSLNNQKVANKAMNDAKQDLVKAQKNIDPLIKQIGIYNDLHHKYEKSLSDSRTKQKEYMQKFQNLISTISFDKKMNESSIEFFETKKQFDTWESEKLKISEEIESINNMLQKARSEINEPNKDFDRLKIELMSRKEKLCKQDNDLNQKKINILNELDNLQNLDEQQKNVFYNKLQILAQYTRNRGIFDAWEFYEKNRSRFRYPIYVPFLHMCVKHERNLIYLNNTIGNRDLGIFIFGCQEDEDVLVGGGNPHKINSTVCDQYNELQHLPDALKSIGFTQFVVELFDAPLPVTSYLCSVFALNTIPIGDQRVDESSEQIAQKIGKQFNLFLTHKNRISVTFSRYSNATYVKRSILNNNGLLRYDQTQKFIDYKDDFKRIKKAQTENDNQRKLYELEANDFKRDVEEFHVHEKAINEKKQNVAVLEQTLNRVSDRLKNFSSKKPDIELAYRAFQERKKLFSIEAVENFLKMIKNLNEFREHLRDSYLFSEENRRIKTKLRETKENLEIINISFDDYQKIYNQKNDECKIIQKESYLSKKEFMIACNMKLPDNDDVVSLEFNASEKAILKKLKENFKEYEISDDYQMINQQIREEYNRLEIGRLDGSRADVDDYKNLCLDCKNIEKEIANAQKIKDQWNIEMDCKLNAWINPLNKLIHKVNDNYSRFFERLGCVGNIELKIPDDKYNINEYGIVIWVKYRNDAQLRPLTHQTQSGGERSVATMLYLMALQDLCSVPFRCVDEINQGMDPDNERRVFNMMVQLLSADGEVGKTQYFLLTPKLLSGLEFNDRVSVHVIHNGPAMANVEFWNPEKFLRARA